MHPRVEEGRGAAAKQEPMAQGRHRWLRVRVATGRPIGECFSLDLHYGGWPVLEAPV